MTPLSFILFPSLLVHTYILHMYTQASPNCLPAFSALAKLLATYSLAEHDK